MKKFINRIFGRKRKGPQAIKYTLNLTEPERKALMRIIVTGMYHEVSFAKVGRLSVDDRDAAFDLLDALGVELEKVRGVTDKGALEVVGMDFIG
ncbi:hypothetical protein MKJ04_11505 [Pontibacter sp. E15-1]|uniref:hypothetical protein n=1 Tax=Pontibacter sp. E15-1 TaxID=2919918 RepID=UPI001F5000FD|nr:hypothetical protein [Pontibacter sp. E15-1]MCJ8165470.1 hypothetical protein [Pontibacter sp. E15-1]